MRAALAQENRHWLLAGSLALATHVAAGGALLLAEAPQVAPLPELPVVLVELPPEAAAAPAPLAPQEVSPEQPEAVPPQVFTPRSDAPRVEAPLPREVVAVSPPPPARISPAAVPAAAAPAPPAAVISPAGIGTGTSIAPGTDARARAEEVDYISLVNAHLARRKRYPDEARQARQQGVVTVRFTVNRDGTVSGGTVRRTSGHELLDSATLDLLQRVSPLPRFPRSILRDSLTIVLPIEYSLRTR